jgi:hypothetical protein
LLIFNQKKAFHKINLNVRATPSTACTTNGGAKPGLPCVFPFKYADVTYNACTAKNSERGLWCSTAVDAEGDHITNNWDRFYET